MVEEDEGGYRRSNWREESELTEQGGDSVKKANTRLKIEDELETANSDKNGNESEIAESVRMFDSETLNQLEAKRKRRQHRDSKGVGKGHTSSQTDRKGRGARNRTGQGVRARHEARRSQSEEPEEQAEPHVEFDEEFWDTN